MVSIICVQFISVLASLSTLAAAARALYLRALPFVVGFNGFLRETCLAFVSRCAWDFGFFFGACFFVVMMCSPRSWVWQCHRGRRDALVRGAQLPRPGPHLKANKG